MRRHAVLTHLNHPAKRYILFTGPEALWAAGALVAGLLVWRWLLPLCLPGTIADPGTGVPTVVAQAPLLTWAVARFPFAEAGLRMYVPFLPAAVGLALVGAVVFFVLWEPGGRKLHRWARCYLRTWRRCPRVATWQPAPRPTPITPGPRRAA